MPLAPLLPSGPFHDEENPDLSADENRVKAAWETHAARAPLAFEHEKRHVLANHNAVYRQIWNAETSYLPEIKRNA